MKFEISSSALSDAVRLVAHATVHSAATPILENTLITAQSDRIILSANNLEMAVEVTVENVRVLEPGQITISHKFLASYVSLLASDKVTLSVDTAHTLVFTTDDNTTRFKGLGAEEFPVIPGVKENARVQMSSEVLKNALSKTLFSCAQGNVRPTLAGVYISIQADNIAFASTDSFRLSEYALTQQGIGEKNATFILPARTASELLKMLPESVNVELLISENQMMLLFAGVKVFSRLLNGHFPNYQTFFPTRFSTRGVLLRQSFIRALKQVSLISRENNYNTKIYFKTTGVELDTGDTEVGVGKVRVKAEVEGEEDAIGVNSVYVLDVLNVIDSEYVSVDFDTNLSPVLIQAVTEDKQPSSSRFRHIVMPLKI